MALMSSTNSTLCAAHRATLLDVARASIQHGVRQHCALPVTVAAYAPQLQQLRATFVTLEQDGALRGCIGTLQAYQALVQDVAAHAFAAAFQDPRFPAVTAAEVAQLQLSISVLSPPTALHFVSEEDVLAQLRPGQDGLILQFRQQRGTFLPVVWEQLSEPAMFLAHLKLKAGLPLDFWSPELQFERYVTECFGLADPA